MPVDGIVAVVDSGRTVSSVAKTGWKVLVERRPRWQLMALVVDVDGSKKHRWMHAAVAGLGRVAGCNDRGGCQVVMDIEVDAVDADGGKGVEVMESSVEAVALAIV